MKTAIGILALSLVAAVAGAQPIGVKVVKDTVNGRILVKADDGTWLTVYGSGAPSFTSFLGENVPAGSIYFNTATATSYGFASGSWSVSSGSASASIVPGTTTATGVTDCFLYTDPNGTVKCAAARQIPNIQCEFTGTNPNPPFGAVNLNGGTTANSSAGVANHPGLITTKSHASNANSGGSWGIGSNAILVGGNEVFEAVVRVDLLTNVTNYLGIQEGFVATAPVNGVYFIIPSTGAVVGETAASSVTSTTASLGTVTTNTFYRLRFEINSAASSVTFYLYSDSGTLIGSGSLSAHIPTTASGLAVTSVLGTATGSAANLMTYDYVSLRYSSPLTR